MSVFWPIICLNFCNAISAMQFAMLILLPLASPFLQARETQLGVQAIWEGRIFCHLRLLVVEQQVLAALVASRFAQAGELLAELIALLDRFPSLLHDCVPSTQMLLGKSWLAVAGDTALQHARNVGTPRGVAS